jgi:hypothetical protein
MIIDDEVPRKAMNATAARIMTAMAADRARTT